MRHFHKCINPECEVQIGCTGSREACDPEWGGWPPELPCEDCSEMLQCEWCGAYVEKLFAYKDIEICSSGCQMDIDIRDTRFEQKPKPVLGS